ncbi:hypothetical protein Asulf_01337 [Archaeoglobus sulfaticallidus PM70-1]|uniref:Uncharacterized protein n=1 Tax=Archaeoglobus sulfaticallidus PM70-1 TaxID=387631 RepID=N0BE81_9EURY|nr:hypothetical protein Asulf_01337 [Archaeoglobus sulfaticallidus PM70-1]
MDDKKVFEKTYNDNKYSVRESVDLNDFVTFGEHYDVKVVAYAKTDKGLCTTGSCVAGDEVWFETCYGNRTIDLFEG